MRLLHAVVAGLAPPLCASCGRHCRPEAIVCSRCARRLAGADPIAGNGPPGTDRAWSSAAHEDVARNLVTALKFRRLLPVAGLMADRVQWLAPADLLSGTIVPVPAAPLRSRARGFDPAGELAAALAERAGLPLAPCLARRGTGRQLGRRRARRIGHPPRIRATDEVPRSVLLVDDVLTTGATLSTCAQALRSAGAVRVAAVTFARRL
jgi:predicted amidophosphoribosyltransferase